MREELRSGGYDVVHIHEPVVRCVGWDALCSLGQLPLVGTFHTYSENLLTNGIAALPLGGRRRMNRLHVRIAVSEAAAWTARRFYGGRYRVIPNGVHLQDGPRRPWAPARGRASGPLRIVFVGQAVERKGLPVLLRAFEALREQVPATLTLVGAGAEEVAHMMLDDARRAARSARSPSSASSPSSRAPRCCARPSLRRRELRHGADRGVRRRHARDRLGHPRLSRRRARRRRRAARRPRATRSRSPTRCARWRSTRPRARMAAPRASAPSASPGRTSPPRCSTAYEHAIAVAARRPAAARPRRACAYGLAPADMLHAAYPPSVCRACMRPARPRPRAAGTRRDCARVRARRRSPSSSLRGRRARRAGAAARRRHPRRRLAARLQARARRRRRSALMCAAMFARAISWHAILARGAHLAARETPRRDAGDIHRRAHVGHAARLASASPRAR